MPNRIIRETIWTSVSLAKCSLYAQGFFLRMIPYPDDFGRFDARLAVIKGRLFPLAGQVSEEQIEGWLQELRKARMVVFYWVGGVRYGVVPSWDRHNVLRTQKSKYPEPPERIRAQMRASASIRPQLRADAVSPRGRADSDSDSDKDSDSEREVEGELEGEGAAAPTHPAESENGDRSQARKPGKGFTPPTEADVRAYAAAREFRHADPGEFVRYWSRQNWISPKTRRRLTNWKIAFANREHELAEREQHPTAAKRPPEIDVGRGAPTAPLTEEERQRAYDIWAGSRRSGNG